MFHRHLHILLHGEGEHLQHLIQAGHRLQPHLLRTEGSEAVTVQDAAPLTLVSFPNKAKEKREMQGEEVSLTALSHWHCCVLYGVI